MKHRVKIDINAKSINTSSGGITYAGGNNIKSSTGVNALVLTGENVN